MLKECAKKKIMITSITFLIFLFTMIFPDQKENVKKTITYYQEQPFPIYLLNTNKYVSRTEIPTKNTSKISLAKEIISTLTKNSPKSIYIPTIFSPVIPQNTKLLAIDLQNTTLKIKFDKTFNNMNPSLYRKAIECLVYSLTEIEGIENILIYIEDTLLNKIPMTNEYLSLPLSRDIGTNKIYSLDKLTNTTTTTAYYIARQNNYTYYVPVTYINNNQGNKIEIIIEELKTRPHLNTNLISYLHANANITNYELLDQEIKLSFNSWLFEGLQNKDIIEEVKYSIALSMQDSLNIKKVNINIE